MDNRQQQVKVAATTAAAKPGSKQQRLEDDDASETESMSSCETATTIDDREESDISLSTGHVPYTRQLAETKTFLLDFSACSPSLRKKGVQKAFQTIVSPLAEPEFAPILPRRQPSNEERLFYLNATTHGRLERTSMRGRRKTLTGTLPQALSIESLSDHSRHAPKPPVRRPSTDTDILEVTRCVSSIQLCSTGLSQSAHVYSTTNSLQSSRHMPRLPQRRCSNDSLSSVESFA
jgi:hypothetical protein